MSLPFVFNYSNSSKHPSKMATGLAALKYPVAISSDFARHTSTTVWVKQHAKSWSAGDFTISADKDGSSKSAKDAEHLFSVEGKWASWSQKRSFTDASGNPVYEMYREKNGRTWYVETAGPTRTLPVVKLQPLPRALKDKVDVHVLNKAANGDEAVLEVRGEDVWKKNTTVYLSGAVVMTARRTDTLSVYVPWKRPEWKVEVAPGLDISLVRLPSLDSLVV